MSSTTRPFDPTVERSGRRWSRSLLVTALLGALLAVAGGSQVNPGPAAAVTHSRTFSTWGFYSYTVPAGVHMLEVTAVGAPGGHGGGGLGGNGAGGGGGRFEGYLDVEPGEELTVFVGQSGFHGDGAQDIGLPGLGWAAGGPGNTGSLSGGAGGGGGGASVVASGSDVLLVAGGGGGGGGGGVLPGAGGNGGEAGNSGRNGSELGAGAGGSGYVSGTNGGAGGNAETMSGGGGGGGGGGGWHGGQGGEGASIGWPLGSSGGGGGGHGGSNYATSRTFGYMWGAPNRSIPAFVTLRYNMVYDTTTTVTIDEPEVYVGDTASALVQVQSSRPPSTPGGLAAPAGSVEVFVGSVSLGPPQALASGMLRVSIDGVPPGDHQVRAVFTPSEPADFHSSEGTAALSVIEGTAQVLLASDGSPSVSGQPVTFTASVSAVDPPSSDPTGAVQFLVDGADYGPPVPLNALNQASVEISDLTVGSRTVTARYEGDQLFGSAESDPLTQQVNPGEVAVVATSSANPSVVGEPIDISIGVAPIDPAVGTPSGTVGLLIDGVEHGDPLDLDPSGMASTTIDDLPVGSSELVARYNGDGSFTQALSAQLTQVVNHGDVAVTLTPPGSATDAGEEATFEVDVEVVSPAVGTPTGSVQLHVGEQPVGEPVDLTAAGETSVLVTSALPVGLNHLTARYLGDANFEPAISNPVEHAVNPGDTTISLRSSAPETVEGDEVGFRVQVAPNAPVTQMPTGTVTFLVNGAPIGAPAALDASGSASITTAVLGVGSHQVSARYSGDETFSPASTGGLGHVVTAAETDEGAEGTEGDTDDGPATARLSYPGGDGAGGEASAGSGATGYGSKGLPVTGVALAGTVIAGVLLLAFGAVMVTGGGRFRRRSTAT